MRIVSLQRGLRSQKGEAKLGSLRPPFGVFTLWAAVVILHYYSGPKSELARIEGAMRGL